MEKIATILNQLVVAKVCATIETKLRLDVHASLQLMAIAECDPFSASSASTPTTDVPIADLRRLLQLGPISVAHSDTDASTGEHYAIVMDHVSIYLSQMFYNLTTISMHDWRTYGQMRNDARHKFHLDTVEDHLPTQTLEQGLDVLEIMRNIHHFVSKYLYNLNNQIFIEKNSNNKHLNTINIQHIANSLRTHGIGIINTTVSIESLKFSINLIGLIFLAPFRPIGELHIPISAQEVLRVLPVPLQRTNPITIDERFEMVS